MRLPSLDGLAQLTPGEWRELRQRLTNVGLGSGAVTPFTQVGRGFPETFRRPLIGWHLRRSENPASVAMRLFMFRDRATEGEADDLLGRGLRLRLQDAGLLITKTDGLTCPWDLNILDDLFLLCDDLGGGGAAVMGAGLSSLIACRAAFPRKPLRSILDLGCGAGTAALAYAPWAPRILGTDINPRAIRLSRINAAFNDIRGTEFATADLFSAVGDERFDLIISQPPFIARAPSTVRAAFLHGGARGDEFPLRVLGEIPAHLADGGRAVLLVDWPEDGGPSVEERVLGAVGDGLQVLVLRAPGMSLDDHCIAYALGSGQRGSRYQRRVLADRDHFAALGITALTSSIIVLRRLAPSWSAVIELQPGALTRVTSDRIETLLLRETLLAGGERELLGARLITPAGIQFLALPDGRVRAEFPAAALLDRAELNGGAYRLIQIVAAAPTLEAAILEFSRQADLPPDEAAARVLPAVGEALRRGVLEPAPA